MPSAVGAALTGSVFVVAIATPPGARYAGPAWLAAGLVVYFVGRRTRGEPLLVRILRDGLDDLAVRRNAIRPKTVMIAIPAKLTPRNTAI